MPFRATWKRPGRSVGRQKSGVRGRFKPWPFVGFPWERPRQDRVNT